ncbi:hypothetical protein MKW98_019592 [Papaver atlanticum]|uniref:Uncharacterized protein n=1 Tax=Papaver atlanticum TaxID=357466 RepID=A0AAD4S956_9MAGN|nr:hypothetical protein MKW98_019592 [Papaver atlanticum]
MNQNQYMWSGDEIRAFLFGIARYDRNWVAIKNDPEFHHVLYDKSENECAAKWIAIKGTQRISSENGDNELSPLRIMSNWDYIKGPTSGFGASFRDVTADQMQMKWAKIQDSRQAELAVENFELMQYVQEQQEQDQLQPVGGEEPDQLQDQHAVVEIQPVGVAGPVEDDQDVDPPLPNVEGLEPQEPDQLQDQHAVVEIQPVGVAGPVEDDQDVDPNVEGLEPNPQAPLEIRELGVAGPVEVDQLLPAAHRDSDPLLDVEGLEQNLQEAPSEQEVTVGNSASKRPMFRNEDNQISVSS